MLPTTFNVLTIPTEGYDPQPIYVEQEGLEIKKVLNKLPPVIRGGRINHIGDFANLGESPQGQLKYEFRANDLLKPLFAHFQCGDTVGTTNYRYAFYPITKQPRNYTVGYYTIGSYGVNPQKVYQLRVNKQLNTGSSYTYSGGIVDKLQFDLESDETVKVTCGFVFTDYSIHDAYMDVPNGTFSGTYSTEEAFNFSDVSLSIAGTNFPLDKLSFVSDHGAQVVKTVGARNPKRYLLGNYKVIGKIGFDLPSNALKLVGSMLAQAPFSITGTMSQGSTKVMFSMPSCLRMPFDYALNSSMVNVGEISFEACGNSTTPPLTITVDTAYEFAPITDYGTLTDTMGATDSITNDPQSSETLTDG